MHNVFLNHTAWKTALIGAAILVIVAAFIQLEVDDLPGFVEQSVFAQQAGVTTVNVGSLPTGIAVDETKNIIYVANYNDSSISVVDGSTDTVLDSFQVPPYPRSMVLDTSTGSLYVSHHSISSVSVIDLATKSVTNTIPVGGSPQGLAFDSGKSKLYVADRGADTIHIINTTDNSVLKTVQVGNSPRDIAINPVTDKVYVAVSDSYRNYYVTVIDSNSDSIITKIQTKAASGVSVDQTNNLVYVSAGTLNILYVIDGSADSVFKVLETGEKRMSDVFVIPTSGKVLVTHSGSGTVAILDISAGTIERKLLGFNPLEIAVNTSTNKAYVTNHMDGTVSVFELM